MNRRWFLGLLGGLPFVRMGRAKEMELNPESIETVEIELPTYARKGDVVYCENMHPICVFMEEVYVGQRQDVDRHLGLWNPRWGGHRIRPGTIPIPGCPSCGAAWTDGMHYHFADGWRYSHASKGLRIKR